MAYVSCSRRVGILGPFGYGNLGDAAIQEAMIHGILKRCPDAHISGFSLDPQDTETRHNIPSYRIYGVETEGYTAGRGKKPASVHSQNLNCAWRKSLNVLKSVPPVYRVLKMLRGTIPTLSLCRKLILAELRHLKQSYNVLKQFDVLIVSGGGQLDDFWGGPWGHPYALFKWALLARITMTNLIVVSVGTGSISCGLTRFFIRHALSLASYRSYRDALSRELLNMPGLTENDPVCPDLAFSLPICRSLLAVRRGRISVGVSPIAHCDPRVCPKKDPEMYRCYVSKMTAFVRWLLHQGYVVSFFSSERSDDRVITDVTTALGTEDLEKHGLQIIFPTVCTVQALVERLSQVDVFVGSRLHGILLSHLVNTPLVAISYDRKVDTLMDQMGLRDCTLDIERFDVEDLIERFLKVRTESNSFKFRVRQKIEEFRHELEKQYDRLFNYIDGIAWKSVQGH